MTFLNELYGIGTLTDPHLDEYDGTEYTTPSILRDDGKENDGEESPRRGNAALRVPATEA